MSYIGWKSQIVVFNHIWRHRWQSAHRSFSRISINRFEWKIQTI